MKNLLFTVLLLGVFSFSFSQTGTKIKVAGNCGMCKKNIETAAKSAGATAAIWNKDTKILTVSFDGSSSTDKIETAIAAAGYDTEHNKASEEAYKKLDECCQYDRTSKTSAVKEASCCKEGASCCKDGKSCKKDMTAGKKGMACCKKEVKCCKEGSCCK